MSSKINVTLDGIFNQNESYDYDEDYKYQDDGFDGDKAVWIPLLYSVLVIVGLLWNGLLLAVLAQKSRSWSVSDSFILQLAVVDILLLVTLPFYAAHANQSCGWCSLNFLRVCGAVFKFNLYIGIFLLVWICLDHDLFSIFAGKCFCRRDNLACMSWILAWLISIVLTALDAIFLLPVTDSMPGKALSTSSRPKSELDWQLISRALHLGVGFLLPTVILITCCSRVIVQCRANVQRRKKPVVLILSLVAALLLCQIPYNVTLVIDVICYTSKDIFSSVVACSLKDAVKITSALSCISACLRPLLFFLFCGNFRKGVFSLLKCAKVEWRKSLWELGVGEEAPHDQCQSEDEMKQMTGTQQQV